MRQVKSFFVDRLGLAAIGIISLGYIMFWDSFAKIGIKLSFLNFPIFIGEMLLVFCLGLLIWKWSCGQWSPGRWGWVLGGYVFFILVKTSTGYVKWGPLALRDAAFFYYPAFIIFGYAFFDPSSQGRLSRRIVLAFLLMVIVLGQFISFAGFSLMTMAVLWALSEENMTIRLILTAGIFVLAPYTKIIVLFQRTTLISYFISFIFLVIMLELSLRWKRIVKISLIVLGTVFISTLWVSADVAGVWKTMAPQTILYKAKPAVPPLTDDRPKARILFNIDGSDPYYYPDNIKVFFERFLRQKPCALQKRRIEAPQKGAGIVPMTKPVVMNSNILGGKKEDALFRYYIWNDMIKEYCKYRPLFGFAFGRPLLSPTMIFYGIPSPESQDGWIGAHNSFLYMLYRGGIIGLAMLIAILVFWAGMVRDFAGLKSMAGIFLCAALLSWMVCACFFLIFELPYTAIPVWTLWGMTAKYRDFLKSRGVEK